MASVSDVRRYIVGESLAGLVGTFALIPEVIAFSYVAGISPQVGLFGSFCIAIVISVTGGRSAMISAAAGSVALVVVSLVRDHGLQYLLAASVLAGVIQIAFGLFRLGVVMRLVSRSVIAGFVNALAILIFAAQMPTLLGAGPATYALAAAGIAMIYLVPRVTTAIPAPLICILVLTAITAGFNIPVKTVGDLGQLPSSYPLFAWPAISLSWQTLGIIAPYSISIAFVGLLESLMTASVVDDLTSTPSDRDRECWGLGIANIVAGLFGGIAGCAMIGQTVSNIKYGGRGRLSTFCAGFFLLVLIVLLKPVVAKIPMVALVSVMITVAFATFNWSSVRNLFHHPALSNVVMIATVAATVVTHNLAIGVLGGVLLSGLFFVFKMAGSPDVARETSADNRDITYRVSGQIFFASAEVFEKDLKIVPGAERVHIDLSNAHFWDISAAAALDRVVGKMRAADVDVEVRGASGTSAMILEKYAATYQTPP